MERKPGEKLTALLHHITPEALREAYLALKRDAAPGRGRGEVARIRGRAGRAIARPAWPRTPGSVPGEARQAGRDTQAGRGEYGPLGIVSLEDKIVQRAVVDNLLNPIYESGYYGLLAWLQAGAFGA